MLRSHKNRRIVERLGAQHHAKECPRASMAHGADKHSPQAQQRERCWLRRGNGEDCCKASPAPKAVGDTVSEEALGDPKP
jgi:hypothetical protein